MTLAVLRSLPTPMLLAWTIAAMLTCVRGAQLARRFGDRPGRVQAVILALLMPLVFVSATTVLLPMAADSYGARAALVALALTLAGWSAVFFSGFAIVLFRSVPSPGTPGEGRVRVHAANAIG